MVAEHLSMTVWEVETEMRTEEFYGWIGWIQFKNEEEKKAAEKAKKNRKR